MDVNSIWRRLLKSRHLTVSTIGTLDSQEPVWGSPTTTSQTVHACSLQGGVATVSANSGANSDADLQSMAMAGFGGYETGSGRTVCGEAAGWGSRLGTYARTGILKP